ncbi:MAG: purine-nucleoside phosphorylase [bacterium]
MKGLYERIQETVGFIRTRTDFKPRAGIILGTGMGRIASGIQEAARIGYGDVPGFPVSTVETHEGNLIFGTIEGVKVVAMQGRFHLYEGYTPAQVTFPVRVMKELGVETLLVSNAAGGLNRYFEAGDLMIIDDHINLTGVNPLIGVNDERLGPRFPDMSEPYDRALVREGMGIALKEGVRCHRGVYLAVTGPCLETAAEYRMFIRMGADAVGMSTVPEVIVAKQAGMRVFGISCITDMCIPDRLKPADIKEIIKTAEEAEPMLTTVVLRLLSGI